MKELKNIIESLTIYENFNEDFYSFKEFKNKIEMFYCNEVEVEDSIFTPYYIQEGKRLELYEYELNIRVVKVFNFEGFLLKITGKERIDDISTNILQRYRNCYIEVLEKKNILMLSKILKYINFIYNSFDVEKQIKECFGNYESDKLFFQYC